MMIDSNQSEYSNDQSRVSDIDKYTYEGVY